MPFLETAGLGNIRTVAADDAEMIHSWRNRPEVRHFMFVQDEISMEDHLAWYAKSSADPRKHLLIYEEDTRPVGFVQFTQMVEGRIAEWSFHTSPSAPKGAGTRLGMAALNHAFDVLSLHKVCGQVLEYNERSINLHRRLGFLQEGLLRDQHYGGQSYYSVFFFGLVCSDWRE